MRNIHIVFFVFCFFSSEIIFSQDEQSFTKLEILSSFSTSLDKHDDDVKRNIYLAVEKLNGYIIKPGTTFSFNLVVGEGSALNGYTSGRVLYRGETFYEPGGGLCQASSTLYNAFLLAGFSIVERHRHMQPVSYVPPGLDATIKYGKKDLKVKNPYTFPIIIEAKMTELSLLISIKGTEGMNVYYEIITEEEEHEVPLPKFDQKYRNGMSIHVYRKKYTDGKLIENFLLHKDYFPPVVLK
jgi:vancomycin resistance protein YoaR